MTFDLESFRAIFPSLPRLTYLNSGSYGLLSLPVQSAFQRYLEQRIEVGADWDSWVGELESVRRAIGLLLSVDTDEVAITGCASSGINALATAIDFGGSRNGILVSDFEFPTMAQIWHAQAKRGAVISHVPETRPGEIDLDAFEQRINDRTAVVAIAQVCYRHGGRLPDNDIRAIAEIARRHGAITVLDTYQIVGTRPIRPHELGVDVCVGGMLKYLLGTAGIGFMTVRKPLIESLIPSTSGWFAQANPGLMDIYANAPSPSARRFESGTPPIANCMAARAGIELVLRTGLENISDQIATVTKYTLDMLDKRGIRFANPREDARRGPLVSIPAGDDVSVVKALAAKQIITSCRDGRVRAGFHAYNTHSDAERFVDILGEILGTSGQG